MKHLIIFFFLAFSITAKSQNNDLENKVLMEIYSYYAKSCVDSPKRITFNSKASNIPKLIYFTKRNYWHLKNILKEDCYSTDDSLKNNRIVTKSFELFSNNTNISFADEKKWSRVHGEKVYIFKRFYCCDKIYVVAVSKKDPLSLVKREFLASFDLDQHLLSFDVQSYIE